MPDGRAEAWQQMATGTGSSELTSFYHKHETNRGKREKGGLLLKGPEDLHPPPPRTSSILPPGLTVKKLSFLSTVLRL